MCCEPCMGLGWPSSPAPLCTFRMWGVDGSPPARHVGGADTQPLFCLGGYSHVLLSPARSQASSYLFLHIVLQFLFSTLFVPFVSCLAELHVLGAARRPAHGAAPAQPGPKCQLLKEMP